MVLVPRNPIGGEPWQNEGWRNDPPGKRSSDQGDDCLRTGKTGGVFTPSATIPAEHNLLLNPCRVDFDKADLIKAGPFAFDHRLAGKEFLISSIQTSSFHGAPLSLSHERDHAISRATIGFYRKPGVGFSFGKGDHDTGLLPVDSQGD